MHIPTKKKKGIFFLLFIINWLPSVCTHVYKMPPSHIRIHSLIHSFFIQLYFSTAHSIFFYFDQRKKNL